MQKILDLKTQEVLELIHKNLIIVDDEAKIVFISDKYCDFLGVLKEKALGKYVGDVIENTRMDKVIISKKAEYSQIQKINGKNMIATRIPIISNGKVLGAIGYVNFKNTDEFHNLYKKVFQMEEEIKSFRSTLKSETTSKYCLDSIIGNSKKILDCKELAKKSALTDSTVLILGENGTGKELFAHAIHKLSTRRNNKLVRVNCSAIPRELLEAELFGYEKGAFTGASKEGRIGKFELANNGTIFLDEIGDMPLFMQAKILRVLQEKEVERIGSNTSIKLNIRIIAATNRDLEAMVEDNSFREDLFYRLNVMRINVPPLREREGDIDILAKYFVNKLAIKFGKEVYKISNDTLSILRNFNWPGNVRQLQNVIERGLNLIDNSNELTVDNLPKEIKSFFVSEKIPSLEDIIEETEKATIKTALSICKGNKSDVAKKLGISRVTLYDKMHRYNIT